MKNFQKLLFFAAFILAITFVACHHDHNEDDTLAPTLSLEKPVDGAVVSGEVHIEGKVTDESLHEMTITVTKDSDYSELFKAEPTVHDKTEFDFDEHFTPTGLTAETPVTLTITVEDHNSNKTSKTVKFKLKP